MWDVHALVERGAVLGRSRRDGCGEGVLKAQTYSREHSNWVALMAWRFWRFCTSSSKVRCLYAVDAASFRRLRLLDGVYTNFGAIWRPPELVMAFLFRRT